MKTSHLSLGAPVLTLICAAALTACGGGGDGGSSSATSAGTATTYAADATQIGSDTASALDSSIQTAQSVVSAQSTAAAVTPGMANAMSVKPSDVTNAPVTCPGGGTATLTITGGTPDSETNGKLDTGEVYTLVYANCQGATGAATLNGSLTLTVVNATTTDTASDLSLTLVANALTVTRPLGTVTLNGSTAHEISTTTDTVTGGTQVTNHFTAPSVTTATQFNSRASTFTLSAVDLTRVSNWLNGVEQSSTFNGTHTVSATLPNTSFEYTVSTQSSVDYSATGVPSSGTWMVTLPHTIVDVTVANGVATITVDDGKDGTIDRTFTVDLPTLQASAG